MKKKLVTLLATAVVSLSIMVSPVLAVVHDNPNGGLCDNTYTSYSHVGFYGSYSIPPHILSDGRSCQITRLVYLHRITCSACGHLFSSSSPIECTETHSLCGTYIVNH